ncbi:MULTISPECIES: hypothetical protein [unclassified Streptomyces]|uniref:hypothetical protein n=1 Tax=unclassified Streptomyces TaxID=2593676 RepID=UPI0035DA6681
MPESSQQDSITPTLTSYGYCSWHKGFAGGVRLIEVIEQGSGPGGALFACETCRRIHRLVPFADRP